MPAVGKRRRRQQLLDRPQGPARARPPHPSPRLPQPSPPHSLHRVCSPRLRDHGHPRRPPETLGWRLTPPLGRPCSRRRRCHLVRTPAVAHAVRPQPLPTLPAISRPRGPACPQALALQTPPVRRMARGRLRWLGSMAAGRGCTHPHPLRPSPYPHEARAWPTRPQRPAPALAGPRA
eukprot:scaffold18613_cov112-Isochrysis_galbana.AAC.5